MYGKANPVDALEVFGEYVRGVHGRMENIRRMDISSEKKCRSGRERSIIRSLSNG